MIQQNVKGSPVPPLKGALIVLGLTVFKFEPLPTILPIAFPTIVIRILQIIDIKRESKAKGSDER